MSKTLKDLCFLTGVLFPWLALILFFVVKNDDYRRAFKISMIYGVVLWVLITLIISLNMCDPYIYGIIDRTDS